MYGHDLRSSLHYLIIWETVAHHGLGTTLHACSGNVLDWIITSCTCFQVIDDKSILMVDSGGQVISRISVL